MHFSDHLQWDCPMQKGKSTCKWSQKWVDSALFKVCGSSLASSLMLQCSFLCHLVLLNTDPFKTLATTDNGPQPRNPCIGEGAVSTAAQGFPWWADGTTLLKGGSILLSLLAIQNIINMYTTNPSWSNLTKKKQNWKKNLLNEWSKCPCFCNTHFPLIHLWNYIITTWWLSLS